MTLAEKLRRHQQLFRAEPAPVPPTPSKEDETNLLEPPTTVSTEWNLLEKTALPRTKWRTLTSPSEIYYPSPTSKEKTWNNTLSLSPEEESQLNCRRLSQTMGEE